MRTVLTVIAYIIFILLLSLFAIFWFDYINVINASVILDPLRALIAEKPEESVTESILDESYVLERLRIEKEREVLQRDAGRLDQQRRELSSREEELDQLSSALDERERLIDEREENVNQREQRYENKEEVLTQNAEALRNMRPERAAEIMSYYDDQLLIDTLRRAEEIAGETGNASLVPFWLSFLDPQRVAVIQRKMTVKPILNE